jgi:hypothetical protein
MGNSVIWYFPDGADRTARIDFGCRILMTGPVPIYQTAVQKSLDLTRSLVRFNGVGRISLQHDWTRDAAGTGDLLRRKLQALCANLQRGGSCVFVHDIDHAFAGFALDLPTSETDEITVDQNLFGDLIGGPGHGVTAGREIMIQSDHEKYLHEHKACTTHSGNTLELEQAIATDMSRERWVLAREYGSYPALRLPDEFLEFGDFVHHDHEWLFSLDLPLEEDPTVLDMYSLTGAVIHGEAPGPDPLDGIDEVHDYGIEIPTYQWKG